MHKEFDFHLLNDEGKKKALNIAENFNNLLTILLDICPGGQELALVRLKLEEACFFAKKAMACDPENHISKNQL